MAAVQPDGPPPTTITSHWSLTVIFLPFSDSCVPLGAACALPMDGMAEATARVPAALMKLLLLLMVEMLVFFPCNVLLCDIWMQM